MAITVYICEKEEEVVFTLKKNSDNIQVRLNNVSLLDKDAFYKLHLDTLLSSRIEIIYGLESKHDKWLDKFLNADSIYVNKSVIWVFKSLPKSDKLHKNISKKFGNIIELKELKGKSKDSFISWCINDLDLDKNLIVNYYSAQLHGYSFEVYKELARVKGYIEGCGSGATLSSPHFLEPDKKIVFKFLDNFFYASKKDIALIKQTLYAMHWQALNNMFFKRLTSVICYKVTKDLNLTKAYWNYGNYGLRDLNKLINTIDLGTLCKLYELADEYLVINENNFSLEDRWLRLIYEWQRITEK